MIRKNGRGSFTRTRMLGMTRQSPIDLYETSRQYIIEADLTMLKQVQAITVTLSGNEFMLSVKTLERTLNKQMVLPFI